MPDPTDHDDAAGRESVEENAPLLAAASASTSSADAASDASSHTTIPGDGGENGNAFEDLSKSQSQVTTKRGVGIALSMWVLIFLQAINMSGMPMAQSTIAEDLNAYDNAMWFTTSYIIAMSCFGPIVGRLAGAIFSPRVLIAGASTIFAIGGALTSAAHSFGTLVAGRVVAGMGGAGILTLGIILVIQLVSDKRRGLFIGFVNLCFTVGLSLGAVVFGAVVPEFGWRVLFLAQAPLSLLGGLGVFFSLPAHLKAHVAGPEDTRPIMTKLANIDYMGALTMIASIVLFLAGLSGKIQPILLILSVVVLMIFLYIEYKVASEPIIPLKVLSSRGQLLTCLAQLGFMAARWTVLFYTPIFALAVRGLSPAVSGAILIPTNAGFGSGGLLVGFFHIRRKGSFWLPCVVSIACFSLSLFFIGQVSTPAVSPALYIFLVFLNGLCTGAAMNYTLHHLLHLVPPETHFVATSLLGTFRGFAGSFGVAIGGGIFGRTLRGVLEDGFNKLDDGKDRSGMISKLIGSPAAVYHDGLSATEQDIAIQGYVAALKTVFTGAVVLAIVVIAIQAGAGWKGAIPDDQENEDEIEEAMENRGVDGD
ncbi:major facilitator superfamily domain-containing protein [Zalerion maritima]|uniref:Major facilitator superfamily domain-containing protein n=1 Tax=Zalerion maritima TaxID=339359 RepID=A0AAD5S1D9_9PEZI|nr:major facilitator superfamily domain-containing protein [Zalerion maritima]